jgi:hypothetical protein
VAGGIMGLVVAVLMRNLVQKFVELLFDLSTEISQNVITRGTPFPLDGCRACVALAHRVIPGVDPRFCERMNEILVPSDMRIPEWHGPPPGEEAP